MRGDETGASAIKKDSDVFASVSFRYLIAESEPFVQADTLPDCCPLPDSDTYVVSSGQGCLDKVQAESSAWDMVLIEAEMPEMDGFATLRRLRRISLDVPVVMMNRFFSPEHTIEGWQCGAQEFLQKPILQADIDRIISKYCKEPKITVEAIDPRQPLIDNFDNGQFFLATSPEMRAIRRQVRSSAMLMFLC